MLKKNSERVVSLESPPMEVESPMRRTSAKTVDMRSPLSDEPAAK